jgi:uncharacterized protein
MEVLASAIWRRIDTPGHDACWLFQDERGLTLDGAAIFKHSAGPARLAYRVRCDTDWRTLCGMVLGYIGKRLVSLNIARRHRDWTLNGTVVPGLEQLDDLDLSFTPATNLLQLRRQDVPYGKSVDIPVAWLDIDTGTLTKLPQVYERRGTLAYWYRAPTVGYEGLLELGPNGFIQNYPQLWEIENTN